VKLLLAQVLFPVLAWGDETTQCCYRTNSSSCVVGLSSLIIAASAVIASSEILDAFWKASANNAGVTRVWLQLSFEIYGCPRLSSQLRYGMAIYRSLNTIIQFAAKTLSVSPVKIATFSPLGEIASLGVLYWSTLRWGEMPLRSFGCSLS
jgi:hypothetical protein